MFGTTITNTAIGGTAPGAGNVISGNDGQASGLSDAGTTGTLVQGNKIGTNALGTAGIANVRAGVRFVVSASNNTVGGTAASAGNLIAYNSPAHRRQRRRRPQPARQRATRSWATSIHSNGGLGIDLSANGVTPNDPGDGDAGPNDLLNFPLHLGGPLRRRDSDRSLQPRRARRPVPDRVLQEPLGDGSERASAKARSSRPR